MYVNECVKICMNFIQMRGVKGFNVVIHCHYGEKLL